MITKQTYKSFQDAFDFYNERLFADEPVPSPLITLQRKAKARGYFAANSFENRSEKAVQAHELAMNLDHFDRSDTEILSTLVHEMVHAWQKSYGHLADAATTTKDGRQKCWLLVLCQPAPAKKGECRQAL
jgi:hypothetical protein